METSVAKLLTQEGWELTQPGWWEHNTYNQLNAITWCEEAPTVPQGTVAYVNSNQPDSDEEGFVFFPSMEEALTAF